jgi:hypothetical protein
MNRSNLRRGALSVPLAILAVLMLVTNVVAAPPTWTGLRTIRSAPGLTLYDADFAGHNVAVAWQRVDGSTRNVAFKFSNDNGNSFPQAQSMPDARQPAIDQCDGWEPNAAYAEQSGSSWIIQHTVFESFDSSFTSQVGQNGGNQHDPDIACAGQRVFVSWFRKVSGGDRLFVAHALRFEGEFSAPMLLGFDGDSAVFADMAMAGVSDFAYVAYRLSSGDLRFKRWSVGGSPDYPVAGFPSTIIGPGTSEEPAFEPVIAAYGDKVAVAWMTCSAVVARVSNDNGATWGPIRTLVEHAACDGDFIAAPNSIAIRGSRIALEYSSAGIFGDGEENLIRTTSDFASFRDDMIADHGHVEHLVGYLRVSGDTKLAAVFQRGDTIRFRRQL